MPLFASASTQNSDLIWKSPYEFFDTRKPLPLSACTAPSASRQLALPIWFQLSRLEPSNSVVHPASPCAGGQLKQPKTVKPIPSNPATMIDEPFIAISSLGPKSGTDALDYPSGSCSGWPHPVATPATGSAGGRHRSGTAA